jgi:hypothetical protein
VSTIDGELVGHNVGLKGHEASPGPDFYYSPARGGDVDPDSEGSKEGVHENGRDQGNLKVNQGLVMVLQSSWN